MSKVVSSVWAVYENVAEEFDILSVPPHVAVELIDVWGEVPPILYGAREVDGRVVEQFIGLLFCESDEQIETASNVAYFEITSRLEEMSEMERFLQSIEGGDFDLGSLLKRSM